jgi:hypothetical protein
VIKPENKPEKQSPPVHAGGFFCVRLRLRQKRIMERILEILAISFVAVAALWFVSAQAWGILDWNSRGAERAAEAKLGLSIAAINWPAQCFKVGAPIIRDLPNPLAGEGYIASLEYAAFDFAPL